MRTFILFEVVYIVMTNIKGRRRKIIEREKSKNAVKRVDRIKFLVSLRSKTKKKTFRATMKV